MSVLQSGSYHLVGVGCDGCKQFGDGGKGQIQSRGDGGVDGLLIMVVVAVLELLIRHELNSSVNNSEQTRSEAFVETRDTFKLADLDKSISHPRVMLAGVN